MKDNTTKRNGAGFLGLLTLLFIGLKLTGFINWSWVWVLSPLWGVAIVTFIVIIIAFVVIIISILVQELLKLKFGGK